MAIQAKVSWSELSAEQKINFGNGCGPDWLPEALTKLLFGWFFEASCRHHDFNYQRGGDHKDRLSSDRGFFKAMLRDVKRLHWLLQLPAAVEAVGFYGLVRFFGRFHFEDGPYKSLDQILK